MPTPMQHAGSMIYGCGSKPCAGEHQNRWYMGVDPPQTGGIQPMAISKERDSCWGKGSVRCPLWALKTSALRFLSSMLTAIPTLPGRTLSMRKIFDFASACERRASAHAQLKGRTRAYGPMGLWAWGLSGITKFLCAVPASWARRCDTHAHEIDRMAVKDSRVLRQTQSMYTKSG